MRASRKHATGTRQRCISAIKRSFSLCVLFFGASLSAQEHANKLRVCAEPNNFPVSDRAGGGFENRIAQLVADDLGLELVTTWHPYWRGFVRKTLGAHRCDVLIGVPSDFDRVLTTQPYYRSHYVFVTPEGAEPVRGFDDPRLKSERVGLQMIANDVTTTPPGFALAPNGPRPNLIGFSVYEERPAAAQIAEAVAKGDVAVGVLWGPQAGYYVENGRGLQLNPAVAPPYAAMLPFEYGISMGVRKGDIALQALLSGVIERRRADIEQILDEYGVPRAGR